MTERDKTTIPCTSPWEPCSSHDECERAGLCLGSEEGVAYQERTMKAFFDALFMALDNPTTDEGVCCPVCEGPLWDVDGVLRCGECWDGSVVTVE